MHWLWKKQLQPHVQLQQPMLPNRHYLTIWVIFLRKRDVKYLNNVLITDSLIYGTGDVLDISSEDAFRELTILEYEKRLAKYQDEYSFIQAEKRYNARWKMIANAYKQKLMEVERLCNEELEKVQKNVNHLQPLKEMVSQWYLDEENHGDSIRRTDFAANVQKLNTFNENNMLNRHTLQKIDAEVNMAPEIFVARFKSDDPTKIDKLYG